VRSLKPTDWGPALLAVRLFDQLSIPVRV